MQGSSYTEPILFLVIGTVCRLSSINSVMACDVDSGAGVTVAFQDISVLPTGEENSLDLYIEHQKDLRRNIVNQEFMVFHGNDPSRVSKARVSLDVLCFDVDT